MPRSFRLAQQQVALRSLRQQLGHGPQPHEVRYRPSEGPLVVAFYSGTGSVERFAQKIEVGHRRLAQGEILGCGIDPEFQRHAKAVAANRRDLEMAKARGEEFVERLAGRYRVGLQHQVNGVDLIQRPRYEPVTRSALGARPNAFTEQLCRLLASCRVVEPQHRVSLTEGERPIGANNVHFCH